MSLLQRFLLAIALGGFVTSLAYVIVQPRRRLAARVRPYTQRSRVALGLPADSSGTDNDGSLWGDSPVRRFVRALLADSGRRLTRGLTSLTETALANRLYQAGMFPTLPVQQRPAEFYLRLVARALIGVAIGGFLGFVTGGITQMLWMAALSGFFATAQLVRSIEHAIDRNRRQIRSELYSLNQILATRARQAGGVPDLVKYAAEHGYGAVAAEFQQISADYRNGTRMEQALENASVLTPEPQAARTYTLLSRAHVRGSDLSSTLLDLSRDLRNDWRHELERNDTKRRAAMIVPLLLVMFPLLLILIAAPIPFFIFQSLGGN